MTKLTSRERKNLPSSDFALPKTRDFPIQDENHIGMAWKMVDQKEGLSDEDRSAARRAILRRANKIGMDTKDWNAEEEMTAALAEADDLQENDDSIDDTNPSTDKDFEETSNMSAMMSFSAMAIEMPEESEEHPNKVFFSGILTRVDEKSDLPVGGSSGKLVFLPKNVAEKSLASLLGMAIDFNDDLSSHNQTQKIGIITEATIVGNAIHIKGFFYALDYPDAVKRIQAEKSRLGFSYEAQVTHRPLDDDSVIITSCVFTGAAVLYKDKAAYHSTSLTAHADEEIQMSKEIMEAIAALGTNLNARIDGIQSEVKEFKASSASLMEKVKSHADKLHAAADSMCAEGYGSHPTSGHASMIHNVANHMMAEAAMGKNPHVFSDMFNANADKAAATTVVAAAAATASKEDNSKLEAIQKQVEILTSQLADANKARFDAAANPNRQTFSPEIKSLLANANVSEGDNEGKVTVEAVDKVLKAKNASMTKRFQAKVQLNAQGMFKGAQ